MDAWSEASIEQNRRWLIAYVWSLIGDRAAADDLVQDTFVIAFQKRDTFRPGTNFGGWLRTIARNCTLAYCKKHARQPLLSHDESFRQLDQLAANEEERSVDPDRRERQKKHLRDCLQRLTESVRHLLDLRYGSAWPLEKIARATGKNLSAVNVSIFRARAALEKCVNAKGRESEAALS